MIDSLLILSHYLFRQVYSSLKVLIFRASEFFIVVRLFILLLLLHFHLVFFEFVILQFIEGSFRSLSMYYEEIVELSFGSIFITTVSLLFLILREWIGFFYLMFVSVFGTQNDLILLVFLFQFQISSWKQILYSDLERVNSNHQQLEKYILWDYTRPPLKWNFYCFTCLLADNDQLNQVSFQQNAGIPSKQSWNEY